MSFLDAIKISVVAIVVVLGTGLYFNTAFTWMGDPHNYVDKWKKLRKPAGWVMLFTGLVLFLATLLYYFPFYGG